jgi:hypothetical protein
MGKGNQKQDEESKKKHKYSTLENHINVLSNNLGDFLLLFPE